MPWLPCFLGLLLLLPALAAQEATAATAASWNPTELRQQLANGDASHTAWAASRIAEQRLGGFVPDVRRALARFAGDRSLASQYVRAQLLDALLQLDVRLPGEELLPHAHGLLRAPALLLAARSPEQNAAYFAARMARQNAADCDLEWCVCGNLLASLRDPRFVARTLDELRFAIRITVFDDRPPSRGVG